MRRGSGSALNAPAAIETEAHSECEGQEHASPRAHSEGHAPGSHKTSEHSIWPVVLSIGLLLLSLGLLNHSVVAAIGGVVILVAIVGWLWQPWVSA